MIIIFYITNKKITMDQLINQFEKKLNIYDKASQVSNVVNKLSNIEDKNKMKSEIQKLKIECDNLSQQCYLTELKYQALLNYCKHFEKEKQLTTCPVITSF